MSRAETSRAGTMTTTNQRVFRNAFQELGSSNRKYR